MKLSVLLLLFFVQSSILLSQQYSGQIINFESKAPVPYVNIGIIGKNIGTVSNMQGYFDIALSEKFHFDSLKISCIGFESRKYLISDLIRSIEEEKLSVIVLEPKIYQLNEVVVKPIDTEIHTLGNFCDPESAYGNSFPSEDLGTEVGVKINFQEYAERGYLKKFRFYVGKLTFDRFKVRLNIYNLKNGLPHQNILKQPIFIDLTSEGEYNIDLGKYSLVVTSDFFVSLEYYTITEKEKGELVFCATENLDLYKGNGFYRLTSQGDWRPEIGANAGFSVEVECEE